MLIGMLINNHNEALVTIPAIMLSECAARQASGFKCFLYLGLFMYTGKNVLLLIQYRAFRFLEEMAEVTPNQAERNSHTVI